MVVTERNTPGSIGGGGYGRREGESRRVGKGRASETGIAAIAHEREGCCCVEVVALVLRAVRVKMWS